MQADAGSGKWSCCLQSTFQMVQQNLINSQTLVIFESRERVLIILLDCMHRQHFHHKKLVRKRPFYFV